MNGKDAVAGVNLEIDASSVWPRHFGSNATPSFDEPERHFNLASNRIAARGPGRRLHPMKQVLHVTLRDRVLGDGVEERCLEGVVVSHRNGVWRNHAFGAFWGRVRVTAIRCIRCDRQSTGLHSPDQCGFGGSDRR